jgi:hypothetical protein
MTYTLGLPWRGQFWRVNHQSRRRTSKTRTHRFSYVPRADALEDRCVPSALAVTNNIIVGGGGSTQTGLIRSTNGLTVYDPNSGVTWLANANLAATRHFKVQHINPDGSMTYQTALNWVAALNKRHYLGHTDWTLPPTPSNDGTCGIINPSSGFGFGFGCTGCPLGELFYTEFGGKPGESISSLSNSNTADFRNFQPYFYWSGTARMPGGATFSFEDGFENTNLDKDVMYAIPEFPSFDTHLQPILPKNTGMNAPVTSANPTLVKGADGTVYDKETKTTWLANANLAAKETFGLKNINLDGSMAYNTAVAWINKMNKYDNGLGWLGHNDWRLPVSSDSHGAYGTSVTTGTEMGRLFYTELGSRAGSTILRTHSRYERWFTNFQPYLYWSSTQTMNNPGGNGHSGFSFGNGFQGSEFDADDLYVIPVFGPTTRAK